MNNFADDIINGKIGLIESADKLAKTNLLKIKVLKMLDNTDSRNPLSTKIIMKQIKKSRNLIEPILSELYSERKLGHCKIFKEGVEDNFWFSVGIVPTKYSHKKVDKNTKVNTPDIDGDENVEETIE